MALPVLDDPILRAQAVPVTVDMYHRLTEEGVLDEDIELIEGALIRKMTEGNRHVYFIRKIRATIEKHLPAGMFISEGHPLTLDSSEPEPDLAVVAGSFEDYTACHPSTALLVIEVAQNSLSLDRRKAIIYARNGIPEYWLVDIVHDQILVHTVPQSTGYQTTRNVSFQENLTPACAPEALLRLVP